MQSTGDHDFSFVLLKLGQPEGGIRFRIRPMSRAAMPEEAIDEDSQFHSREDDVDVDAFNSPIDPENAICLCRAKT